MEPPVYYIGPCMSCFFAVYASLNGEIQRITQAMTDSEAKQQLQKINDNPWKLWKGVRKVYHKNVDRQLS